MNDRITPEQIALQAMQSEAMLWLMNGSNHVDHHLSVLRAYYDAYVEAGGQTWGKPGKAG